MICCQSGKLVKNINFNLQYNPPPPTHPPPCMPILCRLLAIQTITNKIHTRLAKICTQTPTQASLTQGSSCHSHSLRNMSCSCVSYWPTNRMQKSRHLDAMNCTSLCLAPLPPFVRNRWHSSISCSANQTAQDEIAQTATRQNGAGQNSARLDKTKWQVAIMYRDKFVREKILKPN